MTDKQLQERIRRAAAYKAKQEMYVVSARDSLAGYVREARNRGWSLRKIAVCAGLSVQGVALIVGKAK